MSEVDQAIGRNVQEARYRRGLNQSELGQALGIDRTAVSRIERGTRPLSASELIRATEVLDVDAADLLRPSPAPERIAPSVRMIMRSGAVSADDEPQLLWFMSICRRLPDEVQGQPTQELPSRIQNLPPSYAGEVSARRARAKLGLHAEDPVHGLSMLAHSLGLTVVGVRLPSHSKISGCLLVGPHRPAAALINTNHPALRQRFTLAHEIGHYLIDRNALAYTCDAGEPRPGPRARSEYRADIFASAFLVPRQAVRSLFGNGLPDTDHLSAFQEKYGISKSALISRLRGLRLLSYPESRVLQKIVPSAQTPSRIPAFRVIGESTARLLAALNWTDESCAVVADEEVVT